jgi:hypothetical protein
MDNPILSSDVVMLFSFIRMLIYYFLLRFVVTDIYNLFTSYIGSDCTKHIRCADSFSQKLLIVNKLS